MAEPFYWDERGAWYINVTKPNGKRGRVKLHEVKKKAFEIWKAMEANASGLNPEVAYIADKWIADLAGRVASGTLSADYHSYAQRVVTKYLNAHPRQKWSAFTATAVSAYCGRQNWSADHTATVMSRLKQMSKWAAEHHKLPNTLGSLKKPKSKPRAYYCTPDDFKKLVEAATTTKYFFKDFALLLTALWHTGARPGELTNAQIDDYSDGVLTLSEWKNARKTGKKRYIYLNRAAQECVQKSIGKRTSGHIFVGKGGRPYNRDMLRNRVKRLREIANLSEELTAYAIRHGYAARALTQNVPIATLAALLGTSVAEIERTYGHLTENHDHLKQAANIVQ